MYLSDIHSYLYMVSFSFNLIFQYNGNGGRQVLFSYPHLKLLNYANKELSPLKRALSRALIEYKMVKVQ
jgi:hypothetical protein